METPVTGFQDSQFRSVLLRRAPIERFRDLLTAIEWEGSDDFHLCPSCRAMQVGGHEKDCALKAELTFMADECYKLSQLRERHGVTVNE